MRLFYMVMASWFSMDKKGRSWWKKVSHHGDKELILVSLGVQGQVLMPMIVRSFQGPHEP